MVDSEIWFHGTRLQSNQQFKLSLPSAQFPFFVTDNVNYALRYAYEKDYKISPNGRIIVLTLNDMLKVFDFTDISHVKQLQLPKFIEIAFLDQLELINVFNAIMFNLCHLENAALCIGIDGSIFDMTTEKLKSVMTSALYPSTSEKNFIDYFKPEFSMFGDMDDIAVIDMFYELIQYIKNNISIECYQSAHDSFSTIVKSGVSSSESQVRKICYEFFFPILSNIVKLGYNAYMNYEQYEYKCLGILTKEPIDKVIPRVLTIDEVNRKFKLKD